MVMGTTKMKPTLLQRPYSERQKIGITTDLIAAAMREAETKASETEENLDLADIALRILFFLLIHESPLTDALFLLVSKSNEVTTT